MKRSFRTLIAEEKTMCLLLSQPNKIHHLQGATNLNLNEQEARELKDVMARLGVTDFGSLIIAALPILQEYLGAHPDFDQKSPQSDFVTKHLADLHHAESKFAMRRNTARHQR